MYHFTAVSEFKLELQSGNAQTRSKFVLFCPPVTLIFGKWPWNLGLTLMDLLQRSTWLKISPSAGRSWHMRPGCWSGPRRYKIRGLSKGVFSYVITTDMWVRSTLLRTWLNISKFQPRSNVICWYFSLFLSVCHISYFVVLLLSTSWRDKT